MSDPPETQRLLFVGYPETGKTTFLAALWHVVESGEIAESLALEQFYEGNREHIVARHQEWLAYAPVGRTQTDLPDPVELTLRRVSDDRRLRASIPDLSGETFKRQFEERRWTQSFAQRALGADSVLFFVSPLKIDDPQCIADAEPAVEEWGDDDAGTGTVETASDAVRSRQPAAEGTGVDAGQTTGDQGNGEGFEFKKCCSQVKYVDLLQFLISHLPRKPLRVAVVVSALDVLDNSPFENKPEHFLAKRMALVDQFLRARPDTIQYKVYGISAQGAKYDDEGTGLLQGLSNPTDRIRVVSGETRNSDITRPLRWLAFGTE